MQVVHEHVEEAVIRVPALYTDILGPILAINTVGRKGLKGKE